MSPDGVTLWVVNPDADTVTPIDTGTLTAGDPVSVGQEPWSVAVSPFGVVVMNRLGGSLTVLTESGASELPVGPEPGGVALSVDKRFAYVTVSSQDEVAVVDLAILTVVERIPVGRLPWAIAVSSDDEGDATVVVTHRQARLRDGGREGSRDGKQGWLTLLRDGQVADKVALEPLGDGFPNALEGLALVGDRAWVAHLLNSPDGDFTFHATLSGGISTVSVSSAAELTERRINTNEPTFSTPVNFPRAIAVTRDESKAYVVLAGTNAVMGVDISVPDRPRLLGFWAVGKNPRGIVLSPDETRAFVMNYLSRDVSVLDLTDTIRYPELARIATTPETLEAEMLQGKILFNHAADPRLSRLGWVSCASCHLDGGADGTTWSTPEGLRQTMPLWNLEGTAPFHISATRDEIQDFEHDIRKLMGGVGLASGPPPRMLGEPASGRSPELDALAEFVLRGIRVPRAAPGDAEAIAAGRELFSTAGCTECHSGPAWTTSHLPGEVGTLAPSGELEVEAVLHDVGTYNPETDILGMNGFDVPTLLGLHAKAPYLHDGSAQALHDVLRNERHVGMQLTSGEMDELVAFLLSIDDRTATFE